MPIVSSKGVYVNTDSTSKILANKLGSTILLGEWNESLTLCSLIVLGKSIGTKNLPSLYNCIF